MKFGTLHQILNPTVTWPKIEIFKIQDGYGRHLENRFFGHKSSTDCPISAKFCMRKQNGRSTRAGQKLQIFRIQHGGRPPFENRKIAISQWKIVRFWWNLVHCIRCWTRLQSRDQKLQFLKFKMTTAAILKIAFLPLLINRLSDFSEILYEEAERHADKDYMTKLQNFKIQDGGRPPFWKS